MLGAGGPAAAPTTTTTRRYLLLAVEIAVGAAVFAMVLMRVLVQWHTRTAASPYTPALSFVLSGLSAFRYATSANEEGGVEHARVGWSILWFVLGIVEVASLARNGSLGW